ncbi:MAG: hypothetical protein GX640_18040 [Fibrobacter sp.]|nr:hypothetical protein [Fibrobacter sp.]
MKTYHLAINMVIFIICFGIRVSACSNPFDRISAGVVLNDGENFNFSHLKSIGQYGINYYNQDIVISIPQTGIKDIKILTPTTDPINWNDEVEITRVSFFNNYIYIDVRYGGGCKTHEFTLYADSILSGNKPVECRLTLLHNANGDGCKALINETLFFSLANFQKIHPGIGPVKFSINGSGSRFIWYPDNSEAIMYRSHFDNRAMVYLTYKHFLNHNFRTCIFPVMRICTDTSLAFLQSPINYGDYVFTELKWLIDNNIIQNSDALDPDIIRQSIGTKNRQYWTFQDSSLGYDLYFQVDLDSTGTYTWGPAVHDVRDCSESIPFLLPPQQFGTTAVLPPKRTTVIDNNHLSVKLSGDLFQITGNNLKPGMRVELIDLQGKIAEKSVLISNQNGFTFAPKNRFHAGLYYVRINNGRNWVLSNVLLMK